MHPTRVFLGRVTHLPPQGNTDLITITGEQGLLRVCELVDNRVVIYFFCLLEFPETLNFFVVVGSCVTVTFLLHTKFRRSLLGHHLLRPEGVPDRTRA